MLIAAVFANILEPCLGLQERQAMPLVEHEGRLAMFPLILTVLNRDYNRGYYNHLEYLLRTVSKRGNIPRDVS